MLRTRAPLYLRLPSFSLDLHVLGTPPAFVLSQDQTLQLNLEHLSGRLIDSLANQPPTQMTSWFPRIFASICYSVFRDRISLLLTSFSCVSHLASAVNPLFSQRFLLRPPSLAASVQVVLSFSRTVKRPVFHRNLYVIGHTNSAEDLFGPSPEIDEIKERDSVGRRVTTANES